MLMPKKVRYRKVHRGTRAGRSKGGRTVQFGEYGLQAVEPAWITAKLKKVGKLFLCIFPDKPVSKKPAETRMGKGKGNPEEWVAVVKRDRVICEISGLDEVAARALFKQAAYKLPIKTKFVKRETADSVSLQKESESTDAGAL